MASTYASYTRDSGERLKRIAHAGRLDSAASLLAPRPDDVFLDYGCADAHLASCMPLPLCQMAGYDPAPELLAQRSASLSDLAVYSDIGELLAERSGSFTLIACFEVCEHLSDEANSKLLGNIRQLAAPGARVLFGVPIETGPSSLFKNLYRLSRGRRQGVTLSATLKCLVGKPPERSFYGPGNGWNGSHIGFSDRRFRRLLGENGFEILREQFLPFPKLGRLLNNEVYFSTSVR